MDGRRIAIRLVSILGATTIVGAMGAWPILANSPTPLKAMRTAESMPAIGPEFQGPEAEYVPGEILVKFKPAVDQLRAQDQLAARGLQVAGAIQSIRVLKVAVQPGRELETAAALGQNPNVLYAEPNYIAHAVDTFPDDIYFNPPSDNQWGLNKIQAPAAWDITTGSGEIIIAVVDTGIDLDHPDLSCPGKLTRGWDFVNGDPIPDDDHQNNGFAHGTHVAGIAAACTDNGIGVAGVAWHARLMPVKSLDDRGSGTYEDVAKGITFAVDQGADIINLSLGGASGSGALADAVQYADNHGRLVVAATGNTNGPVLYPAAYPEAMAVAATDSSDQRAWFSNYGPQTDIAAPGVGIYSTVFNSYDYKNGTSMATPFVAGLAALIWSASPDLTHDQVRGVIQSAANDLGALGWDPYFGHGRVNAWRALQSIGLGISPAQVSFLIDDDSGPFPASSELQITTPSSSLITWTTSISADGGWLDVTPPASGTVSAASSAGFTLVATRPITYGSYTTTVVVTGTIASGGIVGPATTEAHVTYLHDLYQYRLLLIFKNYIP
jgi:thermitase